MEYQFVHTLEGRIRIKIPRLAYDPDYAGKLKGLVDGINGVFNCKVNPSASSILVEYFHDGKESVQSMQEILVGCINRANGIVSPIKAVVPPQPKKSTARAKATVTPTVPEVVPKTQPSAPEEPAVPGSSVSHTLKTEPEKQPDSVAEMVSKVAPSAVTPSAVAPSEPPEAEGDVAVDERKTVVEAGEISAVVGIAASVEAEDGENAPPAIALSSPETQEGDAEDDDDGEEDEPTGLPSLSQADLAKRLGVVSQSLSPRRNKPDFLGWSRSKDPEGIAWKFDPQAKVFHPCVNSSDPK